MTAKRRRVGASSEGRAAPAVAHGAAGDFQFTPTQRAKLATGALRFLRNGPQRDALIGLIENSIWAHRRIWNRPGVQIPNKRQVQARRKRIERYAHWARALSNALLNDEPVTDLALARFELVDVSELQDLSTSLAALAEVLEFALEGSRRRRGRQRTPARILAEQLVEIFEARTHNRASARPRSRFVALLDQLKRFEIPEMRGITEQVCKDAMQASLLIVHRHSPNPNARGKVDLDNA